MDIHEGAQKLSPAGVDLAYARIRMKSGDEYLVETDYHRFVAYRASGCVIEPRPGDIVLVSENPHSASYILTVLRSASVGESVLSVKGSLKIKAGEGLSLQGEELELTGVKRIGLTTPEFSANVHSGQINAVEFGFAGKVLSATAQKLQLAAESADCMVERLKQRIKRSFKWVEDLEKTWAGRISTRVESDWSLKAGDAQISAEDKVRVGARKIDLG